MTTLRIADVPVRVHWTLYLLLAGWVVLAGWQGRSVVGAAVVGVLFFGSVLAHELGHVVAARWFGVRTRQVILLPIGGAAQMERQRLRPFADLVISLAGPAVNLALGVALMPVAWIVRGELVPIVAAVNLALGLFNLIPAFPMDGGRVLRAVLAELVGARRATGVALAVGAAFAVVFLAIGLHLPEVGLVALACVMVVMQVEEFRVQRLLRALEVS